MAAGARHRSSLSIAALYYILNNWVTFAFKQSLYETNAVPGPTGTLPLFNGIPSCTWRDLRSGELPSSRSSCTRSAGRGAASISVPQKSDAAEVSSD